MATLFFAAGGYAQDTGSLHGTVTDPGGAVVGQAKVQITESGTGTERSTETDVNGAFSFTQVRPGTYSVVVTHDGFRRYQRDLVTVLVASPTALDVQLALGNIADRKSVV